jgi:hypothetical protein
VNKKLQRKVRRWMRRKGWIRETALVEQPLRVKLAFWLLHPMLMWDQRMRFMALPGDVFEDFQRGEWYVIRDVKPRYVVAYPIDAISFEHAPIAAQRVGVSRAYLHSYTGRFDLTDTCRWLPVRGTRAVQAREAVEQWRARRS